MPAVFPLTGFPKDFIPTAPASFIESILDDILEDVLYPYERESGPGKCSPTILNLNTFVQPLDPEVAMDMVDEFCSKKHKKLRLRSTTENYGLRKIFREYSDLKPTCFLVLGEPSEERYEAAKIFAKMTRRVHLDVIDLVNYEMSKESQCGKWIYTNLLEGRCIPVSVVLHLVRLAINQKDVQNAGYILTGFPIITSHMLCADKMPHRLSKMKVLQTPQAKMIEKWREEAARGGTSSHHSSISLDESEHTHINKNKLNLSSESINQLSQSKESSTTVEPTLSLSSREDTLKHIEYFQSTDLGLGMLEDDSPSNEDIDILEDIMNSLKLENKIKEIDISRCVRHQFNFLMHLNLAPDIVFYIRKSYDAQESTTLNSNESFEVIDNTFRMTKLFQVKSIVDDFELDRQRERFIASLPVIGRFLMHFFKECVVKVDSRFSSEATAEQFKRAMSFINYKFSHIPEPISLEFEDKEKISQLSPSEGLEFLCRYKCIEPNLPWNYNDMGALCPVALGYGKFKHGKPNFATRYMGDVYLCSSLAAMNAFIKAPKRYYKPKPNCRIAILTSEVFQANGIVSLFEKVFRARSFRWKDAVSQAFDLVSVKSYGNTEIRAQSQKGQNAIFDMNRSQIKDALEYDSLDTNSRMLRHNIYQLYKENPQSDLANKVITWLKGLDENPNLQENFDKMYTQWILVDMPNQIEFWEKLDKEGLLPDIALVFSNQWEPMNTNIEDFQGLRDEINSRCLQIALTFPFLAESIGKDLSEIISDIINNEEGFSTARSTDSNDVESGLDDEYIEVNEYGEEDQIHGIFKETLEYFQQKNIPVVRNRKSGPLALLDALESYLTLFKQQPLKLNAEKIDKLPDICSNSYPKEPELPRKIFANYKSLYTLDLQYLRKEVIFEYNQMLKNYEKIRISNEIQNEDENEDVHMEADDPSLDIEVLSQENVKSMEELECLRQLPLGNTGIYCPVSLRDENCLRLGRLRFTVTYHSLHYCMSTPRALQSFMNCAFPYALEDTRPDVPPYRVFVIGMAGPNRRNFMKILSNKLSMKPVSYSRLMTEYLHREAMDSDAILYSENEVFESHGRGFLHTIFKQRFTTGILCEGFPNNVTQLQGMLDSKLIPEVVYIVDENPNEVLNTAFLQRFIQWEKQLQYKYNAYLNKLNKFARKSKVSNNAHELATRIRQDSADVKLELGKIRERIKQQEEAAFGPVNVKDSQPVTTSDTRESANLLELNGESLNAFEHFQNEESFFEEESDQYPESPIPSDIDKIKYRQTLLQETKKAIKEEILALKKVIKLLIHENIPVISIPTYCLKKNCDSKLRRCDRRFRKSIFDQVILVSPNTADSLLSTGYALYSHFKNFCPVDAYDLIPINRHFSMKQQNKLYTALYRRHVFFINGPENLVKFCEKPSWYAFKTSPFFLVVPMRILIMGPVCSGVTTLCQRISTEFNFEIVDNNQYKNFLTNVLASDSTYSCGSPNLSGHFSPTSDSLIEFLHYHRNDSPNGFVLDNLPVCPEELVNAARANIGIHLVLSIKCEFWSVWRNWRSAYLQDEPYKCVSVTDELSKLYSSFRDYNAILKKYQNYGKDLDLFNVVYLKNAASKWGLWEETKNEILISLRDIGSYYKNVRRNEVVSLGRLNVFRAEFERRLSPVKLFCPSCLKANKRLVKYRHDFYNVGLNFYTHSCQHEFNQPFGYNNESLYQKYGFPKLETVSAEKRPLISKNMFKMNLVEYGHNFYWSCDRHHIDILLNGQNFLPPEPISYPGYLPLLVTNYFRKDVVNDGFCVATYCSQLPKRVYTQGDLNYAVFYRGKIFLCASTDSTLEFLENPEYYYHFQMPRYEPPYEDLDLKSLQINYGHLTPERIIEALKALAKSRPKHIALNLQDSAAIFIGLYLKTINPISRTESIKFNEELYAKFISECSFLEWLIKKFNREGNPFLKQ